MAMEANVTLLASSHTVSLELHCFKITWRLSSKTRGNSGVSAADNAILDLIPLIMRVVGNESGTAVGCR